MSEKSFVAMATKICPVCGSRHHHDAEILIDRRLRKIDPEKTVTGWGLCEEHDRLFNDGFIALIAVNNAPSDDKPLLKIEEADRTGTVAHLRREAFEAIFDTPPLDKKIPFVFVDTKVIEVLHSMTSGKQ